MTSLADWKRTGNFYDYKSYPIFYRMNKTSEEVLLCLHGFPTSSHDYHKIWNQIAERYAVLTFDLIGYGFSAKPFDFDYTTFAQADVLQALLTELKIKKVHLLTHDYGNTITQELVARRAENRINFSIESICFLNGALFPETHRPVLAQKILISPLGFLFGKLISDQVFKRSLSKIFGATTKPTKEELNYFVDVFKAGGGKRIAHKLIRYMTEREKYRARWLESLRKIDVPFRFINGSADPVSGAHLVERFRQLVPQQTDIIELADVGHFPHFEKPEKVLELYFDFRAKI